MKKLSVLFLAVLLLPVFSFAGQQDVDTLLRRAPVPDKPPYQGEVRLLRRDSALVMQTVLNSKVLRQVVAAISKKELKEWPEDRDGWLDSRRYTDQLFLAYEAVRNRAKDRTDRDDRHLGLLIEFVLDERHSTVAFYLPTVARVDEHFTIEKRELLHKLKTSRTYLINNMLAIARDSFQGADRDIMNLMQPLMENR